MELKDMKIGVALCPVCGKGVPSHTATNHCKNRDKSWHIYVDQMRELRQGIEALKAELADWPEWFAASQRLAGEMSQSAVKEQKRAEKAEAERDRLREALVSITDINIESYEDGVVMNGIANEALNHKEG